jgi:hypothetical protein
VLALIQGGEVAHAKRLAECGQKSAQLECPDEFGAGGCGSKDNFVPITCDSRLCPDCADRRMGQAIEKYEPEVAAMRDPLLATFTIQNVDTPEEGVDQLIGAFGRLRQRVIPPEGEHRGRRWVWGADGGVPVRYQWRRALRSRGYRDLARHLQKRYVEQGRGIPFDEVVSGGIYAIDIKQQDGGRFHVHLHALMDVPYLPQPAVAQMWEGLTGAHVVDLRRLDERGGETVESAVAEVVGYVCKPPEFNSHEEEVEYLKALKGRRLMQPFGDLHGNIERPVAELRCSECEEAPRWWNYQGMVDEPYDTMLKGWGDHEGDRPPPEGSAAGGPEEGGA